MIKQPANYYIRLAKKSDLPTLKEIEIQSAKRFSGTGLIDNLTSNFFEPQKLSSFIDKKQVWIACSQENIEVGFVVISQRGSSAYIEELDVLPDHGKQGIGKRLMKEAIDWAKQNLFNEIFLSTFALIPWNAPFYAKLGFRTVDRQVWPDELFAVYAEELAQGLPMDERVFMKLDMIDARL